LSDTFCLGLPLVEGMFVLKFGFHDWMSQWTLITERPRRVPGYAYLLNTKIKVTVWGTVEARGDEGDDEG
jgi:hypothetical protein